MGKIPSCGRNGKSSHFRIRGKSYVNVGNIVIILNVLMLFKWYDNYYEISYLWQLFDNMSNYVIYLENVKYYRVSVSTFRRRWLRHMIGKKVPLNLRNGLGYKWHVTRMFGHPNSLSWVRVHLWMRMSELVELSPSSLMDANARARWVESEFTYGRVTL